MPACCSGYQVPFPPFAVISAAREEEPSALRYCENIINGKMSKGGWKYHADFETPALFSAGTVNDRLTLLSGRRGYPNNAFHKRVYAHALRRQP